MNNMYYTVDVMDNSGINVLGENMQGSFDTLEEAREYCKNYDPDPDTRLVICTWDGDECINIEDSYN